ncbi:hypothetical protein A1O7_04995 [Cladophialophora yegresii CBS 114405]|uniref:Uncharacterized protein n=1 Tax=Cladophialophora yegresii CBS 114405 TaxID=1182544 RepID=W9VYG5_9EURO|nr:uncharacterized protein A1O7_04995 [Cladophialophora yegresii CBS 114405]EXJ60842.1 hypothetical protein A1O7_04995 [Cladophialophora yegresii CBS 114405]
MPPGSLLRRSIQLPYGIVSVGHEGKPGDDEEKQPGASNERVGEYTEVLRPKTNRSIQRGFSGEPLHIAKPRRAGKLRKAMPIERIQRSPLSAITEFSDPPTSAPPDAREFSAHSTTILLPETAMIRPEKHLSTQWPLANATTRGSRSMPTEIMEITARESVLMRRGGGGHNISSTSPGIPYSTSAISTASMAPDDPLPPLPAIDAFKRPKNHDLRRASNVSLETIGSSVLGPSMSSPADNREAGHSYLARNRRPPTFDLALKRDCATPELQAPPVKKTIHGLVTGASIRSLHPTVVTDEASRARDPMDVPRLPPVVVREESLKTIDASNWTLPPLKVNKIRAQSGQPKRHSMIEPSRLAQWRTVSDPATGLVPEDDVFAIGEALRRPNSVATGNPLDWNRQTGSLSKRHSLTSLTCSDGPKRGHKRQNCIRIMNLPVPEKKSSVQRLPELREELPVNSTGATPKGGPFEVNQPRPIFRPGSPTHMDLKSSPTPSPFKNAPILTPTPRPARKQYIQPPASSASGLRRPSGTARPDSEVFNSNHMDVPMSSPYNNTPRHWPLSRSMQLDVNDTPPSARPSEPPPFESPILPSPAWNSSSLYPRKSLVKGPRSPRNSAQTSTSSTSPLQNKQGHRNRVAKNTVSNGQTGLTLGKTVIMLRSINSEARLLEQRSSNAGDEKSPEITAPPSPPLNKRVMGLRNSSCAPSISSTPPSPPPPQERHQVVLSRGPSPLAYASSLQPNELARGTKPTLCLPRSHLSVSPSTRVTSMMSTGGASIWEDASVRAESPDPEEESEAIAPLALRTLVKTDQNQRSLALYPSRSSSILTRDFGTRAGTEVGVENEHGNAIENIQVDTSQNLYADNNASHVVRRLERVVSGGQWDHKHISKQRSMTTHSQTDKAEAVTPRTRREMDVFDGRKKESAVGLGLTLRLDDLVVGRNRLARS